MHDHLSSAKIMSIKLASYLSALPAITTSQIEATGYSSHSKGRYSILFSVKASFEQALDITNRSKNPTISSLVYKDINY